MSSHHEQRRRQAIAKYLDGDKVDEICQQMGCSKSWLYKWKARYQADDPTWATEQSRRPKTPATQTPDAIEQAVIELRQLFTQRGQNPSAETLRQVLKQQALKPVPSRRTIYRILQRHPKETL